MEEKRIRSARRKHKYATPLGVVFILLAVVGLVAVAVFTINLTDKILDNTRNREKFEKFLTTVVMFDPVAFDSIDKADPQFVLQASLWSTLLENTDRYTYGESGTLTVPASDVEVAAAKLFGADIQLQHQSIADYDFTYLYDAGTQTYSVPVMGQTASYSPKVSKIIREDDLYFVYVGYIPQVSLWDQGNEPDPDKTMVYTLLRGKNGFSLVSIQDTVTWEAARAAESSQPDASSGSESPSAAS